MRRAFALTCLLMACAAEAAEVETSDEVPTPSRPDRPNAVFFEVGGVSGLVSLNYSRQLGPIALRAGVGIFPQLELCFLGPCTPPPAILTFPVLASYVLGRGTHQFELGAGFTAGIETTLDHPERGVALTARAAYRFNGQHGGLFAFGFTPLLVPLDGGRVLFVPMLGLDFGTSFAALYD